MKSLRIATVSWTRETVFAPRMTQLTIVENIDSNFAIIVTVADCGEEFGKVFERVFSGEAFEIDSLCVFVTGDDILNTVVLVLYWMT